MKWMIVQMVWAATTALFAQPGAAQATGWRHDGRGDFPDADPPLRWSASENVVWKTPLASGSNASPVLVSDRLFVCEEPDTLVCIAAADGRVLWRQRVTLADALPPDQREAALARLQVAEALRTDRRAVDGPLRRAERQLRERPTDEALKGQVADLKQRHAELDRRAAAVRDVLPPPTHDTNGCTSATPVSDGRRVFTVFGTGMVAAFDLEGRRLWARLVERPTHEWGHSSSPELAGGRLVVQILKVHGLDPDTGETRWTADSKPRWGSLAVGRAGPDDIVLTANGEAIRGADGRVVAQNLGRLEYCSPLWSGGIAYYIEHGGRAVQFPDDGGAPRTLWTTQPPKERYYASPALADGLLFAIMQRSQLICIDAATGAVVWMQDVKLGGTAYPSIQRAGRHVFVSSDTGRTVVIEPAREFKAVAENALEPFRSTPLFSGRRI